MKIGIGPFYFSLKDIRSKITYRNFDNSSKNTYSRCIGIRNPISLSVYHGKGIGGPNSKYSQKVINKCNELLLKRYRPYIIAYTLNIPVSVVYYIKGRK